MICALIKGSINVQSMNFRLTYISIILLSQWVTNPAGADIYQQRDSKGKVQYSDQPFSYKQGNMREEQRRKNSLPAGVQNERHFLLGHWQLQGRRPDERSAMVVDTSDIWTFNTDGTFLSRRLGHAEGEAHFYFNAPVLETSETGGRVTYRVLEITKETLVLQQESGKQVLHFSRSMTPASKHPEALLYRRDQVASLVILITCGKVIPGLRDPEAVYQQQRRIFLKTGVADFEESIFNQSVNFYRNDATFKEVYTPKITQGVRRCVK